jgi:hypothetical protein
MYRNAISSSEGLPVISTIIAYGSVPAAQAPPCPFPQLRDTEPCEL